VPGTAFVLSFAGPVRAVAALFALTLAIAVWPTRPHADDWHIGYVQRGSIRVTDDGYSFTLVRTLGSRCADRLVEVRGTGPLARTICDDMTVAVHGDTVSHHQVTAVRAHGYNDSKYDRCWEHRCDRAAYVACRGHDYF
jgi:hypothetical protein